MRLDSFKCIEQTGDLGIGLRFAPALQGVEINFIQTPGGGFLDTQGRHRSAALCFLGTGFGIARNHFSSRQGLVCVLG